MKYDILLMFSSSLERVNLHLDVSFDTIIIHHHIHFLTKLPYCVSCVSAGGYLVFSLQSYLVNRIRDSVPKELHCDLYHTLFESHLTYCISVWGDASTNITRPIFTSQKHGIRLLFGDKKAYLDKFRTCARTRPYSHQALTDKFFEK